MGVFLNFNVIRQCPYNGLRRLRSNYLRRLHFMRDARLSNAHLLRISPSRSIQSMLLAVLCRFSGLQIPLAHLQGTRSVIRFTRSRRQESKTLSLACRSSVPVPLSSYLFSSYLSNFWMHIVM